MSLVLENSFKSYIQKELSLANDSLPFEIKNYLVEMLYFFLWTERLYWQGQECSGYEQTLVALHERIQTVEGKQKVHLFKKMGDFTLYISGFFRSALEKTIVDRSYYETMGQSAYSYVACSQGSNTLLFKTLCDQFRDLSESLFYIQKKSELKNEKGKLTFYKENFLQNKKNLVLERILKEEEFLETKKKK